jgi:hypothetical protein
MLRVEKQALWCVRDFTAISHAKPYHFTQLKLTGTETKSEASFQNLLVIIWTPKTVTISSTFQHNKGDIVIWSHL